MDYPAAHQPKFADKERAMKTFEKAGIKYRRTFEALKDLRLNAENPPVFKEIRRMFSLPSAAT